MHSSGYLESLQAPIVFTGFAKPRCNFSPLAPLNSLMCVMQPAVEEPV